MPSEDRSWLESLKHYVSAPRRAFESMARPIDDKQYPVEYSTASPLVNITSGDIDKATEAAMAVSGGGLSTKPIRAYHSSPHDFERFDLGKIGTGEGAQSYGHGLYFAENPAVSGKGGTYWQQFSGRFQGPERQALDELFRHRMDPEKALASVQRTIADKSALLEGRNLSIMDRARYAKSLSDAEAKAAYLGSDKPFGPRTYEVNINADPTHMLDWDKPLREQAPVSAAIAGSRNGLLRDVLNRTDTGGNLYRALSYDTGAWQQGKQATQMLNEAGIPGIRYLDQGSRLPRSIADLEARIAKANDQLTTWSRLPNDRTQPMMMQSLTDEITDLSGQLAKAKATPQSSNYVVFNPSIIDIVKKYGLAGIAAPPAIAGAMNQERQP